MWLSNRILNIRQIEIDMGIFNKFTKSQKNPPHDIITTQGFLIGVAEAEGEANNQNILLRDVFVDNLDVFSHLDQGKFIILGRKGSGKSAIAEYLVSSMDEEPNIFSTIIGHDKIELERLIHEIHKSDTIGQHEQLFKWVVLTQILKLMSDNQHIQDWEETKLLKKFLERNRGFVGIDKYEIYDYETSTSFSIELENLKRLSSRLGKDWKIKSNRAEYYKLLPRLEEVMMELLKRDNENSYLLIFDDLDIGYKRTQENLDILVDLLRTVKFYNLEFSKHGLFTRILVLLRNDIAKHIQYYPDTAKMFASYSTTLRWYQDKDNENDLLLKQFINKRIVYNFKRLDIPFNEKDPWSSFVQPYERSGKTSFKYILDHTFYRPRDLVLFFKDIGTQNYPLPMSNQNIQSLKKLYAAQMIHEVKNELSSQLHEDEIDAILKAVCNYKTKDGATYDEMTSTLRDVGMDNPHDVISTLFEYSLIGNLYDNDVLSFKFREREEYNCEMDVKRRFVLHYILRTYAWMNNRY